MTQQEENIQNGNNIIDEQLSNFDAWEWFYRILHYWYLFVIAAVIAFSLAYLKNKKVIDTYLTTGTLIIKDAQNANYGAQSLMQGFGVDAGYRNVNNQLIILGSYDLIQRTVDSLPFMNVEYITKGRFKTRNIYRQTPIIVEYSKIDPMAYNYLFRCDAQQDGTLKITCNNEDMPFEYTARYGEPAKTNLFTATIWPTDNMMRAGQHIYFRFRSRESLAAEFAGRLQLNFVTEKSTVLGIQLVGVTPARDRDFINKLSDIYLLQNVERKNMAADKSIQFINEQLDALQHSLTSSESAMTDFRQENKFVDVSSYASGLMTKVSQYDQQKMALRLKETYLDYLTNYLNHQIEQGSVVAPATLGLNEPMLMQLVQQLNTLQVQRSELSPKNVYYAKYTNDIENVKNAIAELVQSMRISLDIEKKDLANRFSEVESDIKNLPQKELQMVAIERNYRIDDNYYTFFLQKRAEAEIQKARNTPDSEIMDRARTTYAMNGKEKRKNVITYMVFGLLVPFLLIILSELLNNKVRTPKEAEQLSDFELLGTLRHVSSHNPTYVKKNPRSGFAEMLRGIRLRIEFLVERKTKIAVTVTSTQSGDGKTYISTNLAALYGMTGHPTLLIDMDIRKPNVHEKLGIEATIGVTNYLIGDCTLDDIIIRNEQFGFDVIAAGTVPPNPGELIRSDKLTELLQILRERYDYIVLDSSPVGMVPDALALIEQTDVTLYVIRCMETNKTFAKQALQSLALNHKDKIHLILSDIPAEKAGRRYGYTYGYGYGSGYGDGDNYGYGYGTHYGHYRGYSKYIDAYKYRHSHSHNTTTHKYVDDDDEA